MDFKIDFFSISSHLQDISSLGLPDLPEQQGAPVFEEVFPPSQATPAREALSLAFQTHAMMHATVNRKQEGHVYIVGGEGRKSVAETGGSFSSPPSAFLSLMAINSEPKKLFNYKCS